ncbi:MAG: hypothetical protein JXA00_02085 [Candidatus Thermoplasmatota archaeon]|nr:hypothetical protein [Candidatus Thermoplasmatota archaeon]
MKKLYLLAITVVIAGLMMTSATSMPTSTDAQDDQPTAEFLALPCQIVSAVQPGASRSNDVGSLFAGSQITAGDYDEYRPSIAADTSGTLFVACDASEDGSIYYPTFTHSLDNGATWEPGGYFPDSAGASKPDVDYKPSGFYATFSPPFDFSGQIWVVDATDIANIAASYWDFGSYGIDTFEDMHIATYTHEGPAGDPGAWNFGGLAFTGYNGYSGATQSGAPFVFYSDSETSGVIGWINGVTDCEHASTDIDLVTNMSYAVYDRSVGGLYQLLVRKDNFGVWSSSGGYYSHPMVFQKAITSTGNLKYPDVCAENNQVLAVAQCDVAGNQDIVCYYSSNGMSTFTQSIVADSTGDELYPQITLIKEGVAVCAYIRGTEAYYKVTMDYGVTWSAEARMSDEQISPSEDHALTLAGMSGKTYGIWQDNRGPNVDIYFDTFYQVAAPNVQIGTVGGGIGKITMEVLNTGTGEATDVAWSISVKGGLLGRINVTSTGVIPTLAASGAEVVQTDAFILGLGSLAIELSAGPATMTKTGKVFLFFTKVL